MTIFLDTSFLIAYYNSSDINHESAKNLFSMIQNGIFGRATTSTYVLDELFTYFQMKSSPKKANSLCHLWVKMNEGFASIIEVSWETFNRAAEMFQNQSPQDRLLSFTDCTIVINAREHQIDTIASFDSGFHKYLKVEPNI